MRVLILVILIFCNYVYAQEIIGVEEVVNKDNLKDYKIEEFSLSKPSIPDELILTEFQQKEVLDSLRKKTTIDTETKTINKGANLIGEKLTPAKNDYINEKNRGTVFFNEEKGNIFSGEEELVVRNYSFHEVIIPDGTIIENVNFSQSEPHSDIIQGENLTFINCNLTNVEIKPSWTVINSNTCQIQYLIEVIDGRTYEVMKQEVEEGVYVEIKREDITNN